MEVLEAIKSVKSVSKYKPDPVPEQKVQAVVNAARFAISAENIEPWKFIVVSDEEAKRELAGAWTNRTHMTRAPLGAGAWGRLDQAGAVIGRFARTCPGGAGPSPVTATPAGAR